MKVESTNAVVQNALAARNSAYTDFGLFKDYKTYAEMMLSSLLPKFSEVGQDLKREAEVSKRGTKKPAEHDYIDTCLNKCLAALKEAHDRIQKQTRNVMQ